MHGTIETGPDSGPGNHFAKATTQPWFSGRPTHPHCIALHRIDRRVVCTVNKNAEPSAETVDVICGEPDVPGTPEPDPIVADTTGDDVPDVDPAEADHLARDERAEQIFLERMRRVDPSDRPAALAAAPTLTADEATAALKALGWRVRTTREYVQALRFFQGAWNLGPALDQDGVLGPLTSSALSISLERRRTGRPTASAHFSFTDLACKCGGDFGDCPRIWVVRALLPTMETLRAKAYPAGLVPASVCRCHGRNTAVGGAALSQHQYGSAVDIDYAIHDTTLAAWRIAAGIGRSASTHLVRHADRRDKSGHNPTGGTVTHPTRWNYAA